MPISLGQSIQLHREYALQSLDAASNWRSKNDFEGELFCLYHALKESLCVAVSDYDTPQLGIEYLQTEVKPKIFDRTFELIRELHIERAAKRDKFRSPGLNHLVLTVHSAWLLHLYAEARELASVCDDEEQVGFYQSDVLWRDYARGIAAIAFAGQFTPKQKKYSGYDRHWATYLQLMADICAVNDLSSAVLIVDKSFSQRNRDKRLINDGLDGDGTFPVKWDFRKHSLLLAANHNAAN